MFILIYGKDTYRAWQKFKELIKGFEKRTNISLSLNALDSQKITFQDFKNQLQHNSIFEKEKIILSRDAFSDPDFKEQFLKQAKSFPDHKNTLVIFYEEKNNLLTQDLLIFFQKQGEVYKYQPLTSSALNDWITKEALELGAKINIPTAVFLAKRTGNNLWRLSAEIRKLVAYCQRRQGSEPACNASRSDAGRERSDEGSYKGKNKIIEKKDVELLVKPELETAIFKTIDAIAAKDKKTALALLYGHLEKGDRPLYLLSMIIFQFRNLLLVKDLEPKPLTEMITLLKPMHPFVVRKSSWLAKKFTMQELERIYLKLFNIDLAVKTGKIKPELALELLITDI